MHADGATEAMVDYALQHGKPFAVVPCCVFPDAAPHRRVRRRDAATGLPTEELIPVRSYEHFLDYLQDKAPGIERVDLAFEGRNTCIYRRAQGTATGAHPASVAAAVAAHGAK